MSQPFDIICIGSTSKDIFFPTDEAQVIETPEDLTSKQKIAFELGGKYRVADRFEAPGGVAANVATGLARQGLGVACYSKVGGDDLGMWIQEELSKNSVALDCLFVDANVKTDLSAIVVMTQGGERTIFHNRDANEQLEILEEKLLPASWFFVSALNGDWQANLQKILVLAKKGGVRVALNPGQHNIKEGAPLMREAIATTEVLIINKDEALELALSASGQEYGASIDEERELFQMLHGLGAKIVGLTDGKRGAWASDGTAIWHAPSTNNEGVKDTTGAGDAFSSGFFGALYQGYSVPDALKRGVANAGSVVGFYGASEGLLDETALARAAADIAATKL